MDEETTKLQEFTSAASVFSEAETAGGGKHLKQPQWSSDQPVMGHRQDAEPP